MSNPFLVLVCGGRDYSDRAAVYRALDSLLAKHANLTVIHGACPTGADALAHAWALERERPVIAVPAQWRAEGNAAGPRRNARMLHYLPNGCVAFPGGAGTENMVELARDAGLAVWRPV